MSETIEVSLNELGQITIPSDLKERLGLSPGMTLLVEKGDEDTLRLRVEPEPQFVDKGGVLVLRTESMPGLENITRHEREQRVLDLLQRAGV